MPRYNNNYIFLYYVLIGLCFIIICMLGFLTYVMLNKKTEVQHIHTTERIHVTQPLPSIETSIDNKKDDIPVYPKKLPQYESTQYQQIGILTAEEVDKEPIVLPLFAKKLRNNRDRWQYYTATDKNNMMRLPIVHQNMKCDNDIGCREIYDGDKLSIAIYQGRTFTATIYKVDSPKYFADVY